jgi:hypothetical protein
MSETIQYKKCPNCGHENHVDAQLCVVCSLMLDVSISTKTINQSGDLPSIFNAGSRHISEKVFLHITGGASLEVDLHEGQSYTIGRLNPKTGDRPEIDLTNHQADQHGVSRQHARFIYERNRLTILDLGSANRTYLNNQEVGDRQSRLVRDGDEIRLGGLVMKVQFSQQVDDF